MRYDRPGEALALLKDARYTPRNHSVFQWAVDKFYGRIFHALLEKDGALKMLAEGQVR